MPELTPEEEAFLEEMLKDPVIGKEIHRFPLPDSFRKKHNIKVPLHLDFTSYAKSNYWIDIAMAPKDLPPLIITDVSGNVEPYKPVEEPKIEIELKPTNSLITTTVS